MKKLFLGTLCLSFLVACEENELGVTDEMNSKQLRVEAEIANSSVLSSRTSTTAEGKVSFTTGDKIGFYMPETAESGLWTYNGESWTSSTEYTWPDKESTYDFCAYYPFTSAETRDAITMPDLSKQTGEISKIGTYDFMVARCSSNYATNSGKVLFKGEQAFKHVYAMIAITLKTSKETEGSVLTGVTLSAANLISAYTYHFGKNSSDDGMTVKADGKNELALTTLNNEINKDKGLKKAFVVNPLQSSGNVTIKVDYTRENKKYTASTTVSAASVQKGNLNNLSVIIKKSGLVVAGNSVEDWNVSNLEDVTVEEDAVPMEKHN